jgi:hypothetical protein
MDEHSFLHKNQKLAPKWSGPHRVLHLKGQSNVEIQLKHNNRKTVVHANRLKPYFVANKNLAVCPDFLQPEPPSQTFPDDVHPPPTPHARRLFTCTSNFITKFSRGHCPSSCFTHTHAIFQCTHLAACTLLLLLLCLLLLRSFLLAKRYSLQPPAMRTRSCSHSSSPALTTPAKTKLLMPQVTFQLLPVLQEGEGLEGEEIEKDITEGVTVNFVTGEDS